MEEKDMRLIDRVLRMKIKIFGIEMECIDMMFGIIILTFGLVARLYLFDVVSGDYADAFADWMREIRQAHENTLMVTTDEGVRYDACMRRAMWPVTPPADGCAAAYRQACR